MEKYLKEIEQIAIRCTASQSDGYSQIMRICDAMREEQKQEITISLSESDLERIHDTLGIESYDDIHTAFVDAMDVMVENAEKSNEYDRELCLF